MLEVARLLTARLGKDVNVSEALAALEPDMECFDRLVDGMLDDRVPDVIDDLRSGRIDPVALHRDGPLRCWGW